MADFPDLWSGVDFLDQLRERLASKEVLFSLRRVLEEGRQELESTNALVPHVVKADRRSLAREGATVLSEMVLRKLPAPHPVTVDDLVYTCQECLSGSDLEIERYRLAYNNFCDESGCWQEDYDLEDLGTTMWGLPIKVDAATVLKNHHFVWTSRTGFAVSLQFSWSLDVWHVTGVLHACSTGAALHNLAAQLNKCFETLLHSLQEACGADRLSMFNDINSWAPGVVDVVEEEAVGRDHADYLSCSLDALCESDDTWLGKRIRNAIHCLSIGREQGSLALQLVLYCSALEALVGQRGNIGDTLSRRITTLLVPNRIYRPSGIARIKSIYSSRSKALHEADFSPPDAVGDELFQIASATMRALMEWRHFHRRGGFEFDNEEQECFSQIDDALTSGQPVVGVPDDLPSAIVDEGE